MTHQVLVPPLGQTTETVTLVKWYKADGDTVTAGEPLFAIETDKATLDIEAQATGILRDVAAIEGQEVDVLSAIATIASPAPSRTAQGGLPNPPSPAPSRVAQGGLPNPPSPAPSRVAQGGLPNPPSPAISTGSAQSTAKQAALPANRLFISPRARRLAEANSFSLPPRLGGVRPSFAGTGPEGAIVERDVKAYLSRQSPVASRQSSVPEHPMPVAPPGIPNIRPPISLAVEADASALIQLQQRLARRGVCVTCADIVLRMMGRAALDEPAFVKTGHVDIGIVSLGARGWIVKQIQSADVKGLTRIAQETAGMAASDGKDPLPVDTPRVAGLVFIDAGLHGLDTLASPIDMAGMAVLCMGRLTVRRNRDATVWLSLSADRSLLDSLAAVHFLQSVVQRVEDPDLMLG